MGGYALKHERRTPAHLACMTALTRTGKRDMTNRKPYRTKPMKAVAKKTAHRSEDGAFRSTVPVRFHDASGKPDIIERRNWI